MYLVCVLAAFTILGNSAVLITAARRLSKLKPPEFLTVNLAVTDIGMALSMYPLSIASAFNHAWVGGDSSCIYYGTMGFLFSVASIVTLTVMAVVRCFLTRISRCTGEKMRKKNVSIMILFTWLYALMWSVVPLLGWGKYGPDPFGLSCTISWSEFKVNGSTFMICMFILCTTVPALTIIVCYFGMAWKIRKAYKAMGNSNHIPSAMKVEWRLTAIVVLVSVGFIGCWAPYAAVSLWSVFRSSDSIPPLVSLLPCLSAKSETAYNLFLHYIFSILFRKEMKWIPCFCGKPNYFLKTVNMAEKPCYL
ncbi:opsin-5 [Huso huso]|uniref:Opsin-5 n=1 Tax=Huso huso TaxID=61971 RepID=A0ABR0ZYU1_HUSHU